MWGDAEGDYIVFTTAVETDNPYDRVVIRGRVAEFVGGDEVDRCMDRLAKKYVGTGRFEWRSTGAQRVKILVEPAHVRHVVGVEPFRPGILPES